MIDGSSPATILPFGPPVADGEELYRCLTTPAWWHEESKRVSSAAFSFPVFSVDVASLAGAPEATLERFRPGTGVVSFLCKAARDIGCDPRWETDPNFPDNAAHANVYMPRGERRKRTAKRLAEACIVLRAPSFADELG